MTTFITRLEVPAGAARRLAVKDCIDVAGVPTTAGSRVVADQAEPAATDAACLEGFRAAGVAIVGKANLHELCFGASGVNPHFGTPVNPLDPARIPGGSSSGSAVAVAAGDADFALGTDTGGSIRNPAAYCGVVGLRPSFGLVSVEGTRPLAPSMDTVGPLARTVAEVAGALALAAPGWCPVPGDAPPVIGRLRLPGTDPAYDEAIDRVLAAAELDVETVTLAGWEDATDTARTLMFAEAWQVNRTLYERAADRLGADVTGRLQRAASLDPAAIREARAHRRHWCEEVARVLGPRVGAVALPSMLTEPPRLGEHTDASNPAALAPSLLPGPALTLPVACCRAIPAGLQLLGEPGGESRLLALAGRIEAASASL